MARVTINCKPCDIKMARVSNNYFFATEYSFFDDVRDNFPYNKSQLIRTLFFVENGGELYFLFLHELAVTAVT